MRDKWIDSTEYFGPDRRKTRGGSRRWKERRHSDDAGQLPPLGALLRRLRVQALGLRTAEDRRHVLQMITAATGEAERLRYLDCADALRAAAIALRSSNFKAAELEERLTDAMSAVAAGPR